MSANYSKDLAMAVRDFLEEEDWHFRFEEDDGIFRFGLNLRGKLKNIQYVVSIAEEDFTVYAISPVSADEDDAKQMRQMAEFICRANYGLRDGNFEMDYNDGEIRYKCYVDCHGALPTREMVLRSIHCPAAMFTRYGKGILQVLFNDTKAKAAVAMCEKGLFDRDDDEDEDDEDEDGDGEEETELSEGEAAALFDLLRKMREDDKEDD